MSDVPWGWRWNPTLGVGSFGRNHFLVSCSAKNPWPPTLGFFFSIFGRKKPMVGGLGFLALHMTKNGFCQTSTPRVGFLLHHSSVSFITTHYLLNLRTPIGNHKKLSAPYRGGCPHAGTRWISMCLAWALVLFCVFLGPWYPKGLVWGRWGGVLLGL